MTVALNERALHFACQRVEDFARVNHARKGGDKEDALEIWLQGLGIDEPLKRQLAVWIEGFIGPDPEYFGAIMIGLCVGLFIRQYYEEHPDGDS